MQIQRHVIEPVATRAERRSSMCMRAADFYGEYALSSDTGNALVTGLVSSHGGNLCRVSRQRVKKYLARALVEIRKCLREPR